MTHGNCESGFKCESSCEICVDGGCLLCAEGAVFKVGVGCQMGKVNGCRYEHRSNGKCLECFEGFYHSGDVCLPIDPKDENISFSF